MEVHHTFFGANDFLSRLNDYNLNAFSLFGSEESLLETVWFREYEMRKEYRR